jgi:phosphatidylserine/phosphatidylglycerophosphate/cardiolipin synthase-like enzyme/uncharacterized membrane protein YdjX (TVP38/TMEM64 family)
MAADGRTIRAAAEAPRETRGAICVEGVNVWRRARASRLSVLVDADAYFRAFAEAVAQARESILIVGWDIQAATHLQPAGRMPDGLPPTLREFLNAVLARRRRLRAYLLDWDYALVFALERELLPTIQLGWWTHRRLDFRLDGQHPLGACHHQKIVVVDDAVGFLGGLDLTTNRWDTPAHRIDDPARVDSSGRPYGPFHDVQVAVSGAAAAALGTLARERWRRATGQKLRPPRAGADPWPRTLVPDLENVDVSLARTEPAFAGRPEVREVERLYCDAIAAARRSIYIENQYLTSAVLAEAMAARLEEPDGPEIVIVVPRSCSGWLEEGTMGLLRGRVLRRLRQADRHGRFGAYYPRLAEGDDCPSLNVHGKVMIVDDVLARVASSNLSNRSMGLDTECDLAIEAADDARVVGMVTGLRDRLMAEHLGVPVTRVSQAVARHGSLVAAIESLRGGGRTLVPLLEEEPGWLERAMPANAVLDLERPVEQARPIASVLPSGLREVAVHSALRTLRSAAIVAAVITVWSWLVNRLDASPAAWLPDSALVPLVMVAGFVVGGALMIPTSLLVLAALLLVGPTLGFGLALSGLMTAAVVGWLAGRLGWRRGTRRVAGPHVERIARRLGAGRGLRDVMMLRLVPVAPFTVVSVVCGALGVRLDLFLLATLAGTIPSLAVAALVIWALAG